MSFQRGAEHTKPRAGSAKSRPPNRIQRAAKSDAVRSCSSPICDSKTGQEACPTALAQAPFEHLEIVGDARIDAQRGRRLIPAMHHAVLAPRVVALAIA